MKDQLGIRVLRTEGLGTSSSIPKKEGVWLGTESGATPLLDSAHLVPSAQTGRGPHSSYSDREVTWLALESQTKGEGDSKELYWGGWGEVGGVVEIRLVQSSRKAEFFNMCQDPLRVE
jgi:hypothetical protein